MAGLGLLLIRIIYIIIPLKYTYKKKFDKRQKIRIFTMYLFYTQFDSSLKLQSAI